MTQCKETLKINIGYSHCTKNSGHYGFCETHEGQLFGVENIKPTFSQQLKIIRENAGYSIGEVRRRTNLSTLMIEQIENGTYVNFSIAILNVYAKLYSVKFIISENSVEVVK